MIRDFSDTLIEEFNSFKITDIILFDDISNIDLSSDLDLDGDYPELTKEQKEATEYIIHEEAISAILQALKQCTEIHQNDYYKTLKFLNEYNLSLNDCLYIIKNLTVEDYYSNLRSTSTYHGGNNLIIFKPKNIKLSDGRLLTNLVLYIKIDLDETTNKAIALVSFHKDKVLEDGE